MPVPLALMREQLLPGLRAISYDSRTMRQWDQLFNREYPMPLPEVGIGTATAMAVAAVVMKNPTISRRGLLTARN